MRDSPSPTDPRASSSDATGIRDDPFARAVHGADAAGLDRGAAGVGPLAQRDPDAPPETSAEFRIVGATSFEDLLRRARTKGFVAGAAAGLAAALIGVVVHSWATSETPAPAAATWSAQRPERWAPSPAPASDGRADPAPTARPAPAVRRDLRASAQRTAAPAPIEAQAAPGPAGLDLRSAATASAPGHAGEVTPPEQPAAPAAQATPAPEPASAPASRTDEAPPAPASRRLEQGEVAAALAARRDAIDGCVAAAPEDAQAAGGRLLLVVTIEPAGTVAGAEIEDPRAARTALGACVARVARELSFPPFEGEPVRVELPLRAE